MKYLLITLLGIATALTVANCSDDKVKSEKAPDVPVKDPKGLKIAFYYTDSLQKGYDYFRVEDSLMTIKGEAFQKELLRRDQALKKKAKAFDDAYKARTATSEQLAAWEGELQRENQQLMVYQQNRGSELEKETAEALEVLMKKIDVAAEKYCKKYGINILLKHGQGGQINYADKNMDVTESFIDFLNNEQEQMNKDMGTTK